MRTVLFRSILIAMLIAMLIVSVGCAGGRKGKKPKVDFTPVAWMAGTWSTDIAQDPVTLERWTPPLHDERMTGWNQVTSGGEMVFSETLWIRADEDGDLIYMAAPRGQAATTFRLADAQEGRAVFENPDHDFPTRITYELREGGEVLYARAEGIENGEPKVAEWSLRRILE